MDNLYYYFLVAAVLGAAWLFTYIIPVNLWVTAIFSGVRIGLVDLVFMRFRKVPPGLIVRSLILATKAGIKGISSNQLETHYLAKGHLQQVITALIVADKGADKTNAFRGIRYIVFDGWPLGAGLPNNMSIQWTRSNSIGYSPAAVEFAAGTS